MAFRRSRSSGSVPGQTIALAVAVPQVVAHRVVRMALAGSNPTARDRREFHLMGAEKVAAFYESWTAMYVQTLRIQLEAAASMLRYISFPWLHGRPPIWVSNMDVSRKALTVLGKGMAPVRRRAVANASRLRRKKLR